MLPIGIFGVVGSTAVMACLMGSMSCATRLDHSLISTSTAPTPPAIPLAPNDHGYVRVETKSRATGCSITTELVACQTSANNWPRGPRGLPFHVASVSAAGDFHWVEANLGVLEGRVTLDYAFYSAHGWAIAANQEGTTFTNDRTGHGMFVNVWSVKSF